MKLLKGLIGAFMLMLVSSLALAAAPGVVNTPQISSDPGGTVTVTWTAPTTYTNGAPITETLLYNLYEGPCTLAVLPKVLNQVAILTVTRGAQGPGAWCYQVSSWTANGGESALTARGTKTFPFPTPNAPPTVTVE